MYAIYLDCKRINTTSRRLNEKGYRTKKGSKFSDTTVRRLLEDPVAMGKRIRNHTRSNGQGKAWTTKPKEEWVINDVPAIISKKLYDQVQELLNKQKRSPTKQQGKVAHLFTSYVSCQCGGKMSSRSHYKKYRCNKCNNRIADDDLEAIFVEQLTEYVHSDDDTKRLQKEKSRTLETKKRELLMTKNKISKTQTRLNKLVDLNTSGELPTEGFGEHYKPLYEQLNQLKNSIPILDKSIKQLTYQESTTVETLVQTRSLYEAWPTLTFDQKRSFVEQALESIIIGEEDIEINISHLPYTSPPIPLKKPTPYKEKFLMKAPAEAQRRGKGS